MANPQDDPGNPIRRETACQGTVEHDATQLMQGHREVLIRLGDEVYRLRLTRNGKLILHK